MEPHLLVLTWVVGFAWQCFFIYYNVYSIIILASSRNRTDFNRVWSLSIFQLNLQLRLNVFPSERDDQGQEMVAVCLIYAPQRILSVKGSKTSFILMAEIVSNINHLKPEKKKVSNSVMSLLLLAIWPSAAAVWSGWVVWKLQAALWHWESQPSVLWKSLLSHLKF